MYCSLSNSAHLGPGPATQQERPSNDDEKICRHNRRQRAMVASRCRRSNPGLMKNVVSMNGSGLISAPWRVARSTGSRGPKASWRRRAACMEVGKDSGLVPNAIPIAE